MNSTEELLPLLDSADPAVRDKAALELRDLGDNAAVEPLIKAILNPANVNHSGTLVYALQTLDCSKYFPTLFDLILFGDYEVQCEALSILEKQNMDINAEHIRKSEEKLRNYVSPPHMSLELVHLLTSELNSILDKFNKTDK